MGILIIDSGGNTVSQEEQEEKIPEGGRGIVVPQLEIVTPDSDEITREQEEEQAIIASIIGNPPA